MARLDSSNEESKDSAEKPSGFRRLFAEIMDVMRFRQSVEMPYSSRLKRLLVLAAMIAVLGLWTPTIWAQIDPIVTVIIQTLIDSLFNEQGASVVGGAVGAIQYHTCNPEIHDGLQSNDLRRESMLYTRPRRSDRRRAPTKDPWLDQK